MFFCHTIIFRSNYSTRSSYNLKFIIIFYI
nr:MAG TPA: hypothetical protein [Caudoviricetes sp.]